MIIPAILIKTCVSATCPILLGRESPLSWKIFFFFWWRVMTHERFRGSKIIFFQSSPQASRFENRNSEKKNGILVLNAKTPICWIAKIVGDFAKNLWATSQWEASQMMMLLGAQFVSTTTTGKKQREKRRRLWLELRETQVTYSHGVPIGVSHAVADSHVTPVEPHHNDQTVKYEFFYRSLSFITEEVILSYDPSYINIIILIK